jgi:DNA polymerase (family 10)
MELADVLQHLQTIADLKTISGANKFSVLAYRRVVYELGHLPKSVPVHTLLRVPGVGAGIASVIEEYVATGTSTAYEMLAAQLPVSCLSMTRVHGVGPVTAHKLYLEHGLRDYNDLVAAAAVGLVPPKLAAAVRFAQETFEGRLALEDAERIGERVRAVLARVECVTSSELVGSLRRRCPTVKDLDVLIQVPGDVNAAFDALRAELKSEMNVFEVARGKQKLTLRVEYLQWMACDVWAVPPTSWGSALCYATGSKVFNVRMRNVARQRGWLLNEKGLFDEHETQIAGSSEEEIFVLLDMEFVEPAGREQ